MDPKEIKLTEERLNSLLGRTFMLQWNKDTTLPVKFFAFHLSEENEEVDKISIAFDPADVAFYGMDAVQELEITDETKCLADLDIVKVIGPEEIIITVCAFTDNHPNSISYKKFIGATREKAAERAVSFYKKMLGKRYVHVISTRVIGD